MVVIVVEVPFIMLGDRERAVDFTSAGSFLAIEFTAESQLVTEFVGIVEFFILVVAARQAVLTEK